jgi:O-antigen/teichoic acid export membrane protein
LLVLAAWYLLPLVLRDKPPGLLQDTMFYLWILPLWPLTMYPQAYFQGRLALRAFNATFLAVSIVSTVILLTLWTTNRMTVHSALSASLISYGAAATLSFAILLHRGQCDWRPSVHLARPLLWFGVRQQVGSMATFVLLQRPDLLVLSLLVPAAALGTYYVASSAAIVAAILPTAASFVLYPAFARQSAEAVPLSLARFLLTGGLCTLFAGPLLVGLLPLAVPRVFGPDFQGAEQLTTLLSLGYLIRGWNGMLSSVIRGTGNPLVSSLGEAVELAVLGALVIILAPRLGVMGAASSLLVGAGASFICLLVAALLVARLSPAGLLTIWVGDARQWHRAIVRYRTAPGDLDL